MVDHAKDVLDGQAVYNPRVLAGYDRTVLDLVCRYIWKSPKEPIVAGYTANVGERHLEVGVGTAYFLDHCTFPVPDPKITLVDLNANTLEVGAARLARYAPQTVRANALEPLPVPAGSFDSFGTNYLLHCVPGDWDTKGAVFASAAAALRPGGRLFGATILARGVPVTLRARLAMRALNSRGVFHNLTDDLPGLRAQLAKHFPDHTIEIRGCAAWFEATKS